MNTKNNARKRASMEKIEAVFVQLLQERALEQITVSDICARCGLNRSTFYANYQDVYALADKIKERLEGQVLDLYGVREQGPFPGYDYLPLFRHIRDNQLFYKTYFKLGYDEQHPALLYDRIRAASDFGGRYIEYHLEFFRAGFNALLKRWLAGGCSEEPEVLAAILAEEYKGR